MPRLTRARCASEPTPPAKAQMLPLVRH